MYLRKTLRSEEHRCLLQVNKRVTWWTDTQEGHAVFFSGFGVNAASVLLPTGSVCSRLHSDRIWCCGFDEA